MTAEPESADSRPRRKVHWINTVFLTGTLVLTLAGVPWLIWAHGGGINWWLHGPVFVLMFIGSGLSITLGYHRLFSHNAFKARWPVRFLTLVFGATAMQDSALAWCSNHRRHHKHVDDDDDPYNITRGFWHAHIGWILFKPERQPPQNNVADLRRDPLIMWQHRWWAVLGLGVGFGLPTLIGWMANGTVGALAGFLLGGCARLTAMNHMTFFINSLCHTWGKRPYSTRCTARDSWYMALFTFGEGYHNYHHEFQHDYRNGVKPWQFDPTKWTVWTLEKIGLASNLRRVPNEKIMLSEINEKNRLLEQQISGHTRPVCEKAQAFYNDAHEQLTAAAQAWEQAKNEYSLALQAKIDATKEQLAELQTALDQAVLDLREAMHEWHTAHGRLVGQLA